MATYESRDFSGFRSFLRNFINLVPFYFLIASMCVGQIALASVSLGGIDIYDYWQSPYTVDFSMFYYWKELFSWGIISEISMHSSRLSFILNVSLAILFISFISLGTVRGALLYAAFLSPFGILLSFNVLRQGFATVLLAAALLRLSESKPKSAAALSLVALFFHNFSIVVILPVGFAYLFSQVSSRFRLFISVILLSTLIILGATGWDDVLLAQKTGLTVELAGGSFQNFIYVGIAALITLALFFYVPYHRIVSSGMLLGLASFGSLVVLFDLSPWTLGRIGLSMILISTFLCFESLLYRTYRSRLFSIFVHGLAVISPVIILFHPGALSMIG